MLREALKFIALSITTFKNISFYITNIFNDILIGIIKSFQCKLTLITKVITNNHFKQAKLALAGNDVKDITCHDD